jgi:hypothetical protein
MKPKHSLVLIVLSLTLFSCWKYYNRNAHPIDFAGRTKVLGYKPIYGVETEAKKIAYTDTPQAAMSKGNIYAFKTYIFQLDPGLGIHVFDNTIPSKAHKIGFITVKGCAQISIKDDKIYTNSYDDLVVLDFSDLSNIHEFSRLKGVFAEYEYQSPIAQPPFRGFYECPNYTSFVVGWIKDSVYQYCYKN